MRRGKLPPLGDPFGTTLGDPFGTNLWGTLWHCLWGRIEYGLKARLRHVFGHNCRISLGDSLKNALREDAMELPPLGKGIGRDLRNSVWSLTRQCLGDTLQDTLQRDLRYMLLDKLWDSLREGSADPLERFFF